MSIDRMSRTPSPATEKLSAEEQAIAEFLADAGQTDATTLAPVLAKLRSSDGGAGSARLSTLLVGDSSSRERRRPGLNRLIALTLAVGGAMGLGVGAAAAVNPDFRESAKLTVAALVGSLTAGSSPLTGDTATDDTGDDTSGDGPDDLADGGLLEPRSELLAEESANEAGAPSRTRKKAPQGRRALLPPSLLPCRCPTGTSPCPTTTLPCPTACSSALRTRGPESREATQTPPAVPAAPRMPATHNDFGGETSGDADADEKRTSHGEDTPPLARNH